MARYRTSVVARVVTRTDAPKNQTPIDLQFDRSTLALSVKEAANLGGDLLRAASKFDRDRVVNALTALVEDLATVADET